MNGSAIGEKARWGRRLVTELECPVAMVVRSFTDRRKEGDSYLGKGIGQASCEMLMFLYRQCNSHLLLAQVWMRFVAGGEFGSQGEGGSEVAHRWS
jgi:hypothetical protein